MEFIESPLFTDLVHDYISDHEYAAFQAHLAIHPESGALIPGSGGLRKIRIAAGGKGKSGGARIIYYLKNRKVKYGCSPYMQKMKPKPYQ